MHPLVIVLLLGSSRAASVPAPSPKLSLAHPAVFTPALARPAARTDEVEMPWLWQALRTKVVSRLPRYEQRAFAMHLSPVVVSTVDTVPGVGVEGRF